MSKVNYRKTVLASAIFLALTGLQAYAQDTMPSTSGISNMSESQMLNVNGGNTVGSVGNIDVASDTSTETETTASTDETAAAGDTTSTSEDIQGTANASLSDTASLYLSSEDNDAIKAAEGKTITSIALDGVPDEVAAKLLPLLTEKTGDTVSVESVRNDVAALGGTGVFSQISPSFTTVPEGVNLTFRLVPNPIVHKVDFEGNTVFTDEYLQNLMGIPEDSVLNLVVVSQKVREIEDLYLKQGYLLVSIPSVTVSDDGTLTVQIAEGNIEDIQVVGNTKTREKVITRELRFKEGQPFNKFLASRSMERLYNLGYFEDVNMKLLPGSKDHDVIVEIDVVEQKTGVVTVGAGYSDSDGMVGIIELGENNFRGTGDKINFHWEFGGSSEGKNYQISYTHPWINDNGDSLGFSFFDRRYSYDDYDSDGHTIAEYDKRRKGFNITWGHVSDEYRTNYFNFESVKESYDDEDGFDEGGRFRDEMEREGVTNVEDCDWYQKIMDNFGRTNSFTFTHVFDNRDNYYNASRGRRLSFAATWGGHGLGGDYDFYKFNVEGRFYKPLGRNVLALRVMAGYIDGEISYNQLFNLGGSNTLRGFEDDQFKGRKMYAATLEYRIPIASKVEGVIFTDIGSAWDIREGQIPWYEDDDSIQVGYGVGIRVQTPLGPVRLDYGHGDRNKFHFSFGTQF
jgi:outer membrane protein insertion porin family